MDSIIFLEEMSHGEAFEGKIELTPMSTYNAQAVGDHGDGGILLTCRYCVLLTCRYCVMKVESGLTESYFQSVREENSCSVVFAHDHILYSCVW